ncbi:dermonecrotic toxin domain-containing protein [Pseudomonas sp. S2_H01]
MQSTTLGMTTINAPRALSDGETLQRRAAALMGTYPDLYAMAFQAARAIVIRHTGKPLDPAKVYWHRFNRANNSGATFTGWEHVGPPSESMTLIELVMHRFSASDTVSADELNTYSGFYTVGADQRFYNEHNEVPMLPSDVLQDFWKLDFATDCKHKVEAFWRAHEQDFCTLAKINLLSSAGLALSKKRLSMDDFQTVLMAITGATDPHVTWDMLQENPGFSAGVTMQVFQLAGHEARDMLLIKNGQGRRIVFKPDVQPMFQCFADEPALYQWVQSQLREPETKAALVSHFARGAEQLAFADARLSARADQPWSAEQTLIGDSPAASPQSVFERLRDTAQREMNEDLNAQLTSNASLRKQMWIGYLGAFIRMAGGVAPLAWPVALSLVGAGIASVGLNIDQAIHGRTKTLRKAGVIGAIINAVYLFLNLPLLASIGRAGEAAPLPERASGADTESLAGLEGNEVLDDIPADTGNVNTRGVHVLENGETWITLGDLPYRVRYLNDLNTWAIVDPHNPFAFSGARPVRLNALDQWELLQPPKLVGGKPPVETPGESPKASGSQAAKPYATTSSPFWDTHMQFNLDEERRLSALGNQRQASAVNVYELDSDEEVVSDSEGEDVVIDAWNEKHRVFKTTDNAYFGGAITRYTEDDDAYNVFLRTGEQRGTDQIEALERLVEDISEVEPNNDVALYRGGSGERGTSGRVFREGKLKAGDVLVNTDVTSFSENPYIARVFASSQGGASSASHKGAITFDDTSVVFELPAGEYLNATPISPFSESPNEVESVFLPGHYFQIQRIEEVAGSNYRFMNVQLRQIPVEQVSGPAYDLRTGEAFSRDQYAAKLGEDAKALVDAFFPPRS